MQAFWEQYGNVISHNLLNAGITFIIALAISRLVSWLQKLAHAKFEDKTFSSKTFAQVAKIVVWSVASIIIVANLMGKSPTVVLSGLGALMAVLMLVFRDSLLGLVAGIQLAQNDMVRVGDWITLPKHQADGTVIDIALTTIKVQNFDNTVTMIPSFALISDGFVNWRYMSDSKGRRIKRPLWISVVSIREMTSELRDELIAKNLIRVEDNFISNLAAFEEWIRRRLANDVAISNELTCLVRQTEAKSEGIPVEIYCFTKTRDWVENERIQTDLFNELYVTAPKFGLAIFERSSAVRRV